MHTSSGIPLKPVPLRSVPVGTAPIQATKSTRYVPARIKKEAFSRSIGCQVKPKDIPGLQCLQYVGTESMYTGVHFKQDYNLLCPQIEIPKYTPKRKGRPSMQYRETNVLIEEQLNQPVLRDPEVEEKYVGPLLNGSAPEMIVSSGALGMTKTKAKMQINYKPPSKKRLAEEEIYDNEDDSVPGCSTSRPKACPMSQPLFPPTRANKVLTVKDYLDGAFELSGDYISPFGPEDAEVLANVSVSPSEESKPQDISLPTTSQQRRSESLEEMDPISQSIFRTIEKAITGQIADSVVGNIPAPVTDNLGFQGEAYYDQTVPSYQEEMEEEETYQEPELEIPDEETIQRQMALHRYKEIGRRICELELSDFASEKTKNDRKAFMIASRGEEILAAVKRNLTIIKDKLGEYSEGTIFEHVDELTNSFADVTPNALNRLNELVAEKLDKRAAEALAAQAADLPSTSSELLQDVKIEEREIKLEPLEDQ